MTAHLFLNLLRPRILSIIRILTLVMAMCQAVSYAHAAAIELAWDSVAVADGYRLYYGNESRSYDFSIDVGPKLQHIITDLQENKLYYFAVTAYNEWGESDFSREISTQISGGSGEALNLSEGFQGIDHEWTTINLDTTYTHPVVIVAPPTYHDDQPGVVRLDQVSATYFNIRYQEWDYLDGSHDSEAISFLALEAGRFVMNDGSIWEVGSFDLSGTGSWQTQAFSHAFPTTPRVFLTIQTYNGPQAATVRARNISSTGFQAALFEQESLMDGHNSERIGYLAIHSPLGSGKLEFAGNSYPYLLQEVTVDDRWCPVLSGILKIQDARSGASPTIRNGAATA